MKKIIVLFFLGTLVATAQESTLSTKKTNSEWMFYPQLLMVK